MKEKETVSNECASCFLLFEAAEEQDLCEFCTAHPMRSDYKRLARMIDILDHTSCHRFPKVLKLLFAEMERRN